MLSLSSAIFSFKVVNENRQTQGKTMHKQIRRFALLYIIILDKLCSTRWQKIQLDSCVSFGDLIFSKVESVNSHYGKWTNVTIGLLARIQNV